ncbi:MAG: hypothetical protein P4L67_00275 [Candidatus Pacebacteria bacterium]|nr:hypothetical protein [Candidatus Paceibacterota bacterium]
MFQDYADVEKATGASFPYKYIVYGGNHSDLVGKLVQPRGFSKVRPLHNFV